MALAAILSPIDTSEAWVYYYEKIEDTYSLALLQSSVSGGRDQEFKNRNTIGSRVKPPPSDLAVTSFLGLVRAFGIAQIPKAVKSTDPAIAVISQLSPVVNPIDKVSAANVQPGDYSAVAACGSTTNTGYVSLLKEIGGTVNLVNYTINKLSVTSKAVDVTVAAYSKLASIVVGGKPWVFFQNKAGQYLYYHNILAGETSRIPTTGMAETGTHLAVTFSPDNSILFLYYRNQTGIVARTWLHNGKWSPEEAAVEDAMDDDSAIALVAHEKNIHVYFWNDGQIVHDVNDLPDESQLSVSHVAGFHAEPAE
ncbi:hypothetical protein MKX07_006287 [Trichoderma sp. CBMAI-0711]|uniref:Fucose-specific lectin n=1 Tax=Trichoderma parareesei TaxID=858221 RepID=A0A2H2ZQ53_TRIPA|nr:hypothetical protein MKX07_006287 [Trichoderma sp. CBMAI-0711]OTA02211.1 hypothetical protein A9Z42_0025500 [Trichoderma parareesei]